jgi:hypothetical protein
MSRRPGTVPIYINNFNWLTWPRQMARFFEDVPNTEVIIVDNASTYPPLLNWYESECPYKIVRLPENLGPHAPWRSGAILPPVVHEGYFGTPYYVLTDPDLCLDDCPKDLVEHLIEGYERYPEVTKVGVGLEIGNLPSDSIVAADAVAWERQFWANRRDGQFFDAAVDTTFAVYSIHVPCKGICLRSDRPYIARHQPWYLTPGNISDEHFYYIQRTIVGSWGGLLKQRVQALGYRSDGPGIS